MLEAAQINKMAEKLMPRLQAWRRDFHKHPELSRQEKRTSAKIAEILRGLGLRVQTGIGGFGVVGLLPGPRGSRTVAVRADMDALPVTETNAVPYKSSTAGVMHACGHDAHITMALGAATILSKQKLPGTVKFIFQPAEESVDGAAAMIKDGVMDNPKVDAIFALHVKPDLEFGAVALRDGLSMAANTVFNIQVSGHGGHGARPDLAVDPLPAAHQIYAALQTVRRGLSPLSPCVLSVCAFNGGSAFNIIPETVDMLGTLRTTDEAVYKQVISDIRGLVRNIAAAYRVRATVSFPFRTAAVNNAPAQAALLRQAAADLRIPVRTIDMLMVSEDFAFFQQEAPGVLAWLGTKRGKKVHRLHAPDFDFDEAILPRGAALLALCAQNQLQASR